ncbi:hypothetical protein KSP39_PZI015650 [Platanthera zijinensis]|uniref:Uncharacterized protein n=1 Tax=Platanthera zijinensis TaxID=2320716 RepID=A0AAP0G1F3_9ASPA
MRRGFHMGGRYKTRTARSAPTPLMPPRGVAPLATTGGGDLPSTRARGDANSFTRRLLLSVNKERNTPTQEGAAVLLSTDSSNSNRRLLSMGGYSLSQTG